MYVCALDRPLKALALGPSAALGFAVTSSNQPSIHHCMCCTMELSEVTS